MNHYPNLFSLYIHWPFCSTKCHYCDFVAFEQHGDFQDRYHRALLKEIEFFAKQFPKKPPITTIFIGGGTPSLYPLQEFEALFQTLENCFDLQGVQEVSMEANPADITEERLDAWSYFGVTRLSVGVQVLDDEVLFKLNRRQRTMDVFNAARLIPKYFDNFSFDFIIGLPGVSDLSWKNTINQVLEWPLNHISLYFLTVHEKTPLYFKVSSGAVTLPDDSNIVEMYEWTIDQLTTAGFEQYEISNFARDNHQSLHNKGYWDYKPYKGFGVGACSFNGKQRFSNDKNLTRYLEKIETNAAQTLETGEELTTEQIKMERWMLGLRQNKGLFLEDMCRNMSSNDKRKFLNNVAVLTSQNLLYEKDNQLRLTTKGMILENEVLVRLLQ